MIVNDGTSVPSISTETSKTVDDILVITLDPSILGEQLVELNMTVSPV
jgi:hypothetical protein